MRCWFVFDKSYRLSQINFLLNLTLAQVNCMNVRDRYPVILYSGGNAPILCVRSIVDLDAFAELSPFFGWLSMIACGQDPEETWIYFLRSPLRIR